jgi:hypothetical protein
MPIKFLRGSSRRHALCFFAPPNDPPGGPNPPAPAGTLEEQLNAARADLLAANGRATTAEGQVSSLTSERDGLRTERDNLQSQFNELTTTANQLRTDLGTANANVTRLEGELSTANRSLSTATSNVTRLEALCGLKGTDPKSQVPSNPGGPAATTVSEHAAAVANAKTPEELNAALEKFGADAKEGKVTKG